MALRTASVVEVWLVPGVHQSYLRPGSLHQSTVHPAAVGAAFPTLAARTVPSLPTGLGWVASCWPPSNCLVEVVQSAAMQ